MSIGRDRRTVRERHDPVLKSFGFPLTVSPAMLSETYHSLSDTGSRVFPLVGPWYGDRERTRTRPSGYGEAQF